MTDSSDKNAGASTSRSSAMLGYLGIGSATLFWGISANLGRAVFTGKLTLLGEQVPLVPPLMMAQARVSFAVIVLLLVMLLRRGRGVISISMREVRDCVLLGTLGFAAANYFYYLAIQRTNVATAIILQYIAPALVLLWMIFRGVQSPTVPRVLGVVTAVVGSALAIGAVAASHSFPYLHVGRELLRFDVIGVAAALVAAVAFAFYNIFGRHLLQAIDRWVVLVWALVGASVFWLFVNPPWKIAAAHYRPSQWLFMVIFSISSMLIPYSLYFTGLRHLDATRAIVTSCLEPVFSIVIAAIALDEAVNGIQTVGIVLVLASTLLVQMRSGREEQAGFEPME